jgi:Carboxypeptidase regulatory-like domain
MRQHAPEVGARRVRSLAVITLLSVGLIGGLVSAANAFQISGDVKRTTGDGVPNVDIVVIKRGGSRRVKTTVTDSSGHYTVAALSAGSYAVYALDDPSRARHRIFRQPGTGDNPAFTRIVDSGRVVNFTARGRDDTEPAIDILSIAAPTSVSGVASDDGDDTDGDGTPDRPAAGVGQVVVALARDVNPVEGTANAFNFVTRHFEQVSINDLMSNLSPTNPDIVKYIKFASLSGKSWTASLPSTDRDGNAVFVRGDSYYVAAVALDKAGNVAYTPVFFVVD